MTLSTHPAIDDHWVWDLYEKGLTLIPLGTAGETAPAYLTQRTGSQDEANEQWPKTPREKWADWQNFTPPESKITEWLIKYPGCNFGIVTGKEVNVVDADDEAAIEFVRTRITRTPWMVRTGKGAHFYYQVHPVVSVKNSTGSAKLDIRGYGGYVVAPGSTHYTGRRYELEIDPDYPVDSVKDLPCLSSEDIETIHAYQRAGSAAGPGFATLSPSGSLSFDPARFAPGQERGVSQGNRDDNLTRLVGKWVQEGHSIDDIFARALQTDRGNNPPLGEANIQKIVQSVVGTHFRHNVNDLANKPTPEPISSTGLLLSPAQLQSSAPSWVIKGVMPTQSIGVLFGPSSGGKSFAAIDMALHIAAGRDWHGRKLKRPGGVIYVCGEGRQGIANRLRAWERHYNTPIDPLPIRVTSVPVRFLDPMAKTALMDAIQAERDTLPGIEAIIIDTLNRNFGDGDENSTKDMTRFIDAITDVHKATGATVLIIHHTGLGDGDRARGNGSLKNACDFEIKHEMAKNSGPQGDKVFTLVGKKMKDGSDMAPTHFRLQTVTLGQDEDGEDYASCVIEQVPGDAAEGAGLAEGLIRNIGERQRKILTELSTYRTQILANRPELPSAKIERKDLIELLKRHGTPPNKTSDGVQQLVARGFLFELNKSLYEITQLVESI